MTFQSTILSLRAKSRSVNAPFLKKSQITISAFNQKIESRLMTTLNGKLEAELRKVRDKVSKIQKKNDTMEMAWLPPQITFEPGNMELIRSQQFSPLVMTDAVLICIKIYELDKFTNESNPRSLIKLLNNVASLLEALVNKYEVIRLGTLANTFEAVCSKQLPANCSESPAERVATLALDLVASTLDQTTMMLRDPTKRWARISFKIGICLGSQLGIVQSGIPKIILVGKESSDANKLADFCPPGKILVTKEFKNKLPRTLFRYGHTPNVMKDRYFVLISRRDHVAPSVQAMLKAYTRFKGNMHKDNVGQPEKTSLSKCLPIAKACNSKICTVS